MRATWRTLVACGLLAASGFGGSAPAAEPPAGLNPAAGLIYSYVMTPKARELGWREIPWLTDLAEGVERARDEKRPLLLFVTGDDPLEKC